MTKAEEKMAYEEIVQAVAVMAEYVVRRKGAPKALLLLALLRYAAFLGITTVKNDGADVDGFLALCREAFEIELRRVQTKKEN